MSKIVNMRIVSDNDDIIHHFALAPERMGAIREIDGKKYKVINNNETFIVSYQLVDEIVINVEEIAIWLDSIGTNNLDTNAIVDALERAYDFETKLAKYFKEN